MAWTLDARLPVVIVADAAALAASLGAGPKAAVLAEAPAPAPPAEAAALEGFDPVMPHTVGCACCGGRPPAAAALDRLFQARLLARNGWGQEKRKALRFAFYVRSHWLRMPPLMLARHLWIKATR